MGAVALAVSENGIGHQLKGALMVAAGSCFYAFGLVRAKGTRRPPPTPPGRADAGAQQARRVLGEAIAYVGMIELGALLTLTLDWTLDANRWIGIAAQLVAGAAGIVGCARYMAWERASEITALSRTS